MEEKNTNPIDFVIIWVDGNDKQWQEEKAKYDGKTVTNANSEVRFRDWDNLQYWFMSMLLMYLLKLVYILAPHYSMFMLLLHNYSVVTEHHIFYNFVLLLMDHSSIM